MKKSDADNSIDWVAYDNDKLEYQSAWDIDTTDLIKYYGVIQKFTDGGISADFYKGRSCARIAEPPT
jgi:ribonucleoside-diphosphate reductase alpha chain